MKKLIPFAAAVLMLMFAGSATLAQALKAKTDKAATIYVAPLQFYKYYGIKTQVLQTGEKFPGRDYSYTKTYEVGEKVKKINDVYDIVGEVPDADLEAINANLLARCKEFFGEDKVKVWPDDVKKGAGDYDQKAIDCEFYVILSRISWSGPVALKTFVFNEDDKEYKMMGDGETIKITIYEKTKAGKKGKKALSSNKGVFYQIDPLVYHYTGEDDQSKAAAEFISTKANKALADKVNELLDEFFAEIAGS